jgi:hypothetical protein
VWRKSKAASALCLGRHAITVYDCVLKSIGTRVYHMHPHSVVSTVTVPHENTCCTRAGCCQLRDVWGSARKGQADQASGHPPAPTVPRPKDSMHTRRHTHTGWLGFETPNTPWPRIKSPPSHTAAVQPHPHTATAPKATSSAAQSDGLLLWACQLSIISCWSFASVSDPRSAVAPRSGGPAASAKTTPSNSRASRYRGMTW